MHVFDASSILYAWDNYPIEKFPPLWNWMAQQVAGHQFVISKIAFDEVKHKAPDCGKWLEVNNIQRLALSDEILQLALSIKQMLGITEENYGKGVGENDLLIIATAKVLKLTLITEERKQFPPPREMKKRRIPSVCNLEGVDVICLQFIDLIKETDAVFDLYYISHFQKIIPYTTNPLHSVLTVPSQHAAFRKSMLTHP